MVHRKICKVWEVTKALAKGHGNTDLNLRLDEFVWQCLTYIDMWLKNEQSWV
jgi:hypothetical protein